MAITEREGTVLGQGRFYACWSRRRGSYRALLRVCDSFILFFVLGIIAIAPAWLSQNISFRNRILRFLLVPYAYLMRRFPLRKFCYHSSIINFIESYIVLMMN